MALILLLTGSRATAHLELVRIAAIPGYFGGCFPCGDANHNGRKDILGAFGRPIGCPESLLIAERAVGDSFVVTRTQLRTGTVWDLGDGDRDGLSDILTTPGSESLCVFESSSPDSFPSRLTWSTSAEPGNMEFGLFCEFDRDSQTEIVVTGPTNSRVRVYENRGDNEYVAVPFPQNRIESNFAVGDFDGDSLTELVGGNGRGDIHLFECVGNDSYARVCSLVFWPNEIEAYNTAASRHVDLDGHPGFISLRRVWNVPSDSCRVRIYLEPVHGQLVCVCSLDFRFAILTGNCVAAGDLDGDSVDEIAVSNGIDVRLFKCVGPNTWEQVWQWDHGTIPWIRFYDINQDSRNEMIISADSTYIWEDTSGLAGAAIPKPPSWVRSIAVEPTVSRRDWPAIFTGLPDGATVEVHSMAGRLVRVHSLKVGPSWTWDLRDQAGNLVPAGTYFAVVRSKGKSTSLKLCIVK